MNKSPFIKFGLLGIVTVLIAGVASMAFTKKEKPVLYLVGDSTMSIKDVSAYPETGWGMPFVHYFTDEIEIQNHARNGRSTRTFIEEGRWDTILEDLKAGDYVFIQFGHNDEVQTKPRSTTPEQYRRYLKQYIADSREKGAQPVLLTPVTRRYFDDDGQIEDTHDYSPLMREVAESEEVPLIDMDKKSQALMNELGDEKSELLFLHLEPGQNPNYPDGLSDDTHFSETGARMIAELVIEGIQELNLGLAEYIVEGEG